MGTCPVTSGYARGRGVLFVSNAIVSGHQGFIISIQGASIGRNGYLIHELENVDGSLSATNDGVERIAHFLRHRLYEANLLA